MKQLDQVKEWHLKFGVPVLNNVEFPSSERCRLRQVILTEEMAELWTAIDNRNMDNVSKEMMDVLYVLLGTALEFGLHNIFELLFDEVHRSNMSKLDEDGNPIFREDGKVLKSKLFSKPNLNLILWL